MLSAMTGSGRRQWLAASAIAGAAGIFLPAAPVLAGADRPAAASPDAAFGAGSGAAAALAQPARDPSIRPFRFRASDEALAEMRRRIAATIWPDKETVADSSQGVPLATMQKLARYWATDYDWRKGEARLNGFPQFVTQIDGLDIHFIHVRSKHPDALPLVISHGWPGSVLEQIKLVGPLTDPLSHGGRAEDAFHVVIPSMPGYGFSGKPTGIGWGPERMARAWAELMKWLGNLRSRAADGLRHAALKGGRP